MNKVKDKTAPRAEGIMLFPQPGKGVVEGKQTRRAFPAHPTKAHYRLGTDWCRYPVPTTIWTECRINMA